MPIQTNAQNTYAAIGIREDLTDIIALIDPQETPFISNIGTGPAAKQTKHEWQVQPLSAPSKTNFKLEGDVSFTPAAATNRQRLFNYCAISRRDGSVTGTMDAVDVAGISNELDNQKMLKAVELRRDMEVISLDNNAYVAGGTATVRECAGLAAYITNTSWDTGQLSFSVAAGTGADQWNLAATTTRAMSLTSLNASMEAAHISGGKPDMLLFSPKQKTAFSNLTLQSSLGGATQVRYNLNGVRPAALIGAVDTWLSNFGQLDVMSDVQLASDSGTTNGLNQTAFLIDSRYAKMSYLRPTFSQDLAILGDATTFMVVCEYTLQVDAPKAHAILFALL